MGTVALAQSAKAGPSASVVVAICAAEIFGLAGFSIVPALLPQFIEVWSLTNTQAGRLAGRWRLDVAVNLAAAFDLDPAIADCPRDPARCLDHQAVAHHEAAFEA